MARFYANENFPQPVVEELRGLGHDVVTVLETGKAGLSWPDEEVLEFAFNDDRILLTLNRKHFLRLHNAGSPHAGIVTCTVDTDFTGQGSRIHAAIAGIDDLHGKIVRVNRPNR